MGDVLWLTIDEKSMLTTPLLTHLSQVTGVVRTGLHTMDLSYPFGGLNVVLIGDFHQFPPIASTKRELYNRKPSAGKCQLGRHLFEQFNIVIKLDEQMRIQDPGWNDILQRARTGDCTTDDIAEIRKLVLENGTCKTPDFTQPPWNEAILVTPRNAVRTAWNTAMLSSYCQRTGQTKYIIYAHDTCKNQPLTPSQRLTAARLKPDETN